MIEKNEKTSRRDALRRMAKASMGVGMCLQLVGSFVPAAQAALTPAQGARFGIIGHMSSPAIGVQTAAAALNATNSDCYTNGYTNNGGFDRYSKGVCP